MNTIAIIGGGASGMMAAIFAARKGAKVLLLEQNDRLGKKILVTGNGRCNYTNTYQDTSCYRSEQPNFITQVLDQFPAEKVIAFFRELGIYPKDRNGYLYPYSDQASAIRDVLEQEVYRLGVDVRTGISCTGIQKTNERFSLQTSHGSLTVDQVILCNGSKAAPSTGSDGSGYTLARQLGHQIIPVLPALCALHCTGKHFRAIAGVRAQGKVSLFVDGELTAADTGELQLTAYGISGIPVFQISRYASKALYEQKEVVAMLDFLPEYSVDKVKILLKERAKRQPEKTAEQFFTGLFHEKLATVWLKFAKIKKEKLCGNFTDADIQRLAWMIKEFKSPVIKTNSYEQAQICCGGVDTTQINPETMESRLVSGLYFAGELVDVDAICGGYNLTWAWASGYVAGRSAASA